MPNHYEQCHIFLCYVYVCPSYAEFWPNLPSFPLGFGRIRRGLGSAWVRRWETGHPQAQNYIHPALNSAGFRPGEAQRVEML